MFKKTAIALGLVIAAGSAAAAQDHSQGAEHANENAMHGQVTALFQKLDTNNDKVISKQEAQADPRVAKLYSKLMTNDSIKTDPAAEPSDTQPGGITLNQLQSGMEAASGGTVGEAVSGGETYTVKEDGSKKMQGDDAMSEDAMNDDMAEPTDDGDMDDTMDSSMDDGDMDDTMTSEPMSDDNMDDTSNTTKPNTAGMSSDDGEMEDSDM